jgi:signal peptidase I
VDFIACFGKRNHRYIIILIITLGGYICYINYANNTQFTDLPKRKESMLSVLIFAVVVTYFVHTFIVQPFIISTSSMEKTLLVGDLIFVSKLHYGLRIPMTPYGVPIIHNYINIIRLPYIRMPSLVSVKRNDIIVFNFPQDSVHTSPDRKDNHIKRCVGLPGDIIEIRIGNLLINGKTEKLPFNAIKQNAYIIKTKNLPLNIDGVKEIKIIHGEITYVYIAMMTKKNAKLIKSLDHVLSVEKLTPKKQSFLNIHYDDGPLRSPKKRDHILFKNKFSINGVKYYVKQNYYFVMGDNRYYSFDSRYWGFLSEDHIIGKPFFSFMSIDWDRENPINFFKWNIRWNRTMTCIHDEKINNTLLV